MQSAHAMSYCHLWLCRIFPHFLINGTILDFRLSLLLIGHASSNYPWPVYKYPALLSLSILHTVQPAFEDGTDRRFRNVGKPQYDAGEIPGRTYTKWYNFQQILIEHKTCVCMCFFLYKSVCNISHSKKSSVTCQYKCT
jgi:hypothetical protein